MLHFFIFLFLCICSTLYGKNPLAQPALDRDEIKYVAQMLREQWHEAPDKEALEDAIPISAKYLTKLDGITLAKLQKMELFFKKSCKQDLESFLKNPSLESDYYKRVSSFLIGQRTACYLCATNFEYVRCYAHYRALQHVLNKEILETYLKKIQ